MQYSICLYIQQLVQIVFGKRYIVQDYVVRESEREANVEENTIAIGG
jgi:hypothetical protein